MRRRTTAGSLNVLVCLDLQPGRDFAGADADVERHNRLGRGRESFTVTTGTGCTWTAATTSAWIHITSGSGTSSGTVSYTVDANPGASRTGTITVDDQTYTVSQESAGPVTVTNVTVQAKPTPPPGVGGVDTLWQTTGVTLTAGQPVTIAATGSWVDASVSYTAAGHATTTVTGPNCPLSGQKLMALIGRIGTSGTPFLIGPTLSFTPGTSGLLYLAPQDNWYTHLGQFRQPERGHQRDGRRMHLRAVADEQRHGGGHRRWRLLHGHDRRLLHVDPGGQRQLDSTRRATARARAR